jgi:hypothetical protein
MIYLFLTFLVAVGIFVYCAQNPNFRIEFISQVDQLHKFLSVQISALVVVLAEAQEILKALGTDPNGPLAQFTQSPAYLHLIAMTGAAAVVARAWKQFPTTGPGPTQQPGEKTP